MTKFSKTLKKIRQFKLFGGGEIQYKRYTRSKFVTAFFVVALLGFGFIFG